MYPLGSCTMKYNPRVNESWRGWTGWPRRILTSRSAFRRARCASCKMLSEQLIEITGMDAITLQPAAGAHGELTGILLVRAYLESQGNPRKKILIPDSAHGTNPATAAMCGYAVENLKSNAAGMVDIASLEAQVNEDVAALMLTNPNTLGVFEQRDPQDCRRAARQGRAALHGRREHERAGGQGTPRRFRRRRDAPEPAQDVLDAARRRRAGLGPGGLQENPRAVSADARRHHQARRHAGLRLQPAAVHRTRAHVLRQLRHARARAGLHHGERPDGLRQTTEDAVLNANYIRKKLEGVLRPAVRHADACTRWCSATACRRARASRPATSPSG